MKKSFLFLKFLAVGTVLLLTACSKNENPSVSLVSNDGAFTIEKTQDALIKRIQTSTGFRPTAIITTTFTRVTGGYLADVHFTLPDGKEKNMLIVQAGVQINGIQASRITANTAPDNTAAKEREFWCDNCAGCLAVWDLNKATIHCNQTCCHLHVKEVDPPKKDIEP